MKIPNDSNALRAAARAAKPASAVGEAPRTATTKAPPAAVTERVLVLSDLHVGQGRDPKTGRMDPCEDFLPRQARQLTGLLTREWTAALGGVTKARAGDFAELVATRASPAQSREKLTRLTEAFQPTYALRLCFDGDLLELLETGINRSDVHFPDGLGKDGAPRNTPANNLVQMDMVRRGHPEVFRALALHLLLGQRVDVIPGNHDRQLLNDHVWSGEIEVGGRRVGGFTRILAEEMSALGATPEQSKAALGRLERKVFGIYGDVWVDHGDAAGNANRTQRPLKEIFDPTPLHTEMALGLGDYIVREAFNQLERVEPRADNATGDLWLSIKMAARHPIQSARLAKGVFSALRREGSDVSRDADFTQRLADAAALVEKFPSITESLNADRPEGEKLSAKEVATGLAAMEEASGEPFFSRFPKDASLVKRIIALAREGFSGMASLAPAMDPVVPSHPKDRAVHRALVAQEHFDIQGLVDGHTHKARDENVLSADGDPLHYVNTHTWIDRLGHWAPQAQAWGEGRGVGVIELGVDEQGRPAARLELKKLTDEDGTLVDDGLEAAPQK